MKVMKFGGTSVGSPSRMKDVVELVKSRGRNIVVLSAMSGTTNTLVTVTDYLRGGNRIGAAETLTSLKNKYSGVIKELFTISAQMGKGKAIVEGIFNELYSYTPENLSEVGEKEILSKGELLSTNLVTLYMEEQGIKVVLLPALSFMKKNSAGEPDADYIRKNLNSALEANPDAEIFITQGFICRDVDGNVDNLQRGGSDYTASLIGAAIDAEEIEIWTDIDGMHNNDPRFVENTSPVSELHFDEAAELAYFGAKILHPTCVLPAKYANIPVRLLNTMEPTAPGTLIFNALPNRAIKAVAAKDGITAIKIKSSRMLLAYGFLRKIFEIFEVYHTSIDMIVTSEVGVSVTIDNEHKLNDILEELRKLGTVTVDRDMVIICVVGDLEWQNRGFEAEVVNALKDVPVRMISYGGSNYNISLLIKASDKVRALKLLSNHLFANK
ncbi:MAG: aspartate kinase [Paramuribaculum sp.]|jgi:aspartate kinase